MITIGIIKQTTHLTNAQLTKMTRAIDTQVRLHLAPIWGVSARVAIVPEKSASDPNVWPVRMVDEVDLNGALGYHHTTNGRADGKPIGFVGVLTDLRLKLSPSVTLSHEVLEMLVNPTCNAVMPYPGGRSVSMEICDPVQADKLGYTIGDTLVSDFITPAWYTGEKGIKSYARRVSKPLALAKGGYISLWDGTKWDQMVQRAGRTPSRADTSLRSHRGA